MNLTSIALRFSLPVLISGAVLASASTAHAENVIYTEIVGYNTETIRGGDALSFIGINLLSDPLYDGTVSAVAQDTLSLTGVDLLDLLDPLGHYFVDIVSAQQEQAVGVNTSVLHWDASTLTLADDLSDLLSAGVDRIRIHRLPTIGEVFGEGGDVLQGGTVNNADMVYLPNPEGSDMIALYYSSSPLLGTGWRKVGEGGDKSDTPIYFTDGIYVHKRSVGDVALGFHGRVKSTRSVVMIPQGFVPYSSVFPAGSTLGNSGLFNADNPQQSLRAGTAASADAVLMDVDQDGEPELYYYSAGGLLGTGWRKVGEGSDKSDTPLTSGFGVINRGEATAVVREPSY